MTPEIKSKLKVRRGAYKIEVKGRLELAFAARCKLLRGEIVRGGDLVTAADGTILEVLAAPEEVAEVRCDKGHDLARVAHELGSRHVPVEFGDGSLRIAQDHALEAALKALGAKIHHATAPFEPHVSAAHDHRHEHDADHEHHRHEHHGHGHKH